MRLTAIVKKYGIILDKEKDQHFMISDEMMEKMIKLADLTGSDVVLEIGSGIGTLTRKLLATNAKIIAVEKDDVFVKILRKEFQNYKNLKIINGNILGLIEDIKFNKSISNIPYSIVEALITRLTRLNFDVCVFSVPLNFFQIITSKFGSKKFSTLSLRVQSFFSVEFGFYVSKEMFYPQPATDSVVISIRPLKIDEYKENPEKYILREMFLQPKKKLKNALREAVINLNKKIYNKDFTKRMAKSFIKDLGIDKEILEKRNPGISDWETVLECIRLHKSLFVR